MRDNQMNYRFDEFLEHVQVASKFPRPDEPSLEHTVIHLSEYMRSQYSDADEAIYKTSRCALILGYIAQHMEDFDVGDYAVQGSPAVGALVGEHVLRAVHQLLVSDHLPQRDPSPEEVLHLAREFKDDE